MWNYMDREAADGKCEGMNAHKLCDDKDVDVRYFASEAAAVC